MTARLTDDEIRKLRYYRDACVHSPEWRLTFMGIPMDTALDRLLDELLEHRAREASIRKYWLDCHDDFMKECRLTAEQPNDMLRDVKWEIAADKFREFVAMQPVCGGGLLREEAAPLPPEQQKEPKP